MGKKQDKLHKASLIRIAAYEALSTTQKAGYTRPAEVSCKRVEPKQKTVPEALRLVSSKGASVNGNVIDFRNGKANGTGKGTKATCDFLKKMGYTILGL